MEGSLGPLRKDSYGKGTPRWDVQGVKCHTQASFLNPDPFSWWYGIQNVAMVRVNRESCMVLLDNGAQINTIMPEFIENHSLDVGPLPDLIGGWVTCTGLGNTLTQPMGYVVIWVQVDGVQGCDRDQIVLIILDLSNFVAWVPMILETPTISHIMNMIREGEIDTLPTPWVNAQVAYLLAVRWATTTVGDDKIATKVLDPVEYDEIVTTKDSEMIGAFSSRLIHARVKAAFTGLRLNVMTQALCADEGPLPQSLTIQNTYMEMCSGSKSVTIIMRNSMAYHQTSRRKLLVARVVAANWVPESQMRPGMIEALDEAKGIWPQRLTVKQRQEKLFKKLDLSGLESWPTELASSVWSLLAEYLDIFSLEPTKLGSTHSTEHVIKVTDDIPFK